MYYRLPFLAPIYKAGALLLLTYALVWGLVAQTPAVGDLGQTARNLFYHVPQWFTMYLMMAFSLGYSIAYLSKGRAEYDTAASQFAQMGVFFGILGLTTGMVWSRVTWGRLMQDTNTAAWWSWDPKQTFALAAVLIYCAYLVLRNSVDEAAKRGRLAAIYNIFAFSSLIPLTLVVPRILGGLHPGGSDGSPVFNSKDISDDFRIIFYPAILGFMCLGLWITELRLRTAFLAEKEENAAAAAQNQATVVVVTTEPKI